MAEAVTYPECLHCLVHGVVEDFFEEHGERDPETGACLMNSGEVTYRLIEVVVDVCMRLPTDAERREAIAFAQERIDSVLTEKHEGVAPAYAAGPVLAH